MDVQMREVLRRDRTVSYLHGSLSRQLANWLQAGYTSDREAQHFLDRLQLLARFTGREVEELMEGIARAAEELVQECESLTCEGSGTSSTFRDGAAHSLGEPVAVPAPPGTSFRAGNQPYS